VVVVLARTQLRCAKVFPAGRAAAVVILMALAVLELPVKATQAATLILD
jgi:hypothetical protein